MIRVPDTLNLAKSHQYHSRYQEWEATIEQDTIYYEFDDFTSTTPACPIIQYAVTDIVVTYALEGPDSLNTRYGKRPDGKYVYQQKQALDPGGTPSYESADSVCHMQWQGPPTVGTETVAHAERSVKCTDDNLHCMCTPRQ